MPYDIHVLDDEKIILVTHTGDVDMAELDRARKDAAELSEARRINRILVDNREVTSFFNMTEHFVFNASHAEILPGNIKIGIVFSEETFDYNKYVEDVAITSGTNLKVFLDERKAKEWLLEDG
jgi:hypothetical protein